MQVVAYVLGFISAFVGASVLGEVVPQKAWIVILAGSAFIATVGSTAMFVSCCRRRTHGLLAPGVGGVGALIWCVLLLLSHLDIRFPSYLWLVSLPLVLYQWLAIGSHLRASTEES